MEAQVTEQDQYTLEGSLEEEEDLVVMEVGAVEVEDVEEGMVEVEVVGVGVEVVDADSGIRNVNVVILYVR